jgi:hypothetical protein
MLNVFRPRVKRGFDAGFSANFRKQQLLLREWQVVRNSMACIYFVSHVGAPQKREALFPFSFQDRRRF